MDQSATTSLYIIKMVNELMDGCQFLARIDSSLSLGLHVRWKGRSCTVAWIWRFERNVEDPHKYYASFS